MSGQPVQHLTGKDYRVIYGRLLALTAFEVGIVMLGWPKQRLRCSWLRRPWPRRC